MLIPDGACVNRVPTNLDEVFVLEPDVFRDERGFLLELWNAAAIAEVVGSPTEFVQGNHSRSAKGVLRGLHYQLPNPQAKLVRCITGSVWDIAVDVRRSSPTFGLWAAAELSAENMRQMWIPEGFAHGFLALADGTDVVYQLTASYEGSAGRRLRWDDPDLAIAWPLEGQPQLSSADAAAPLLGDALLYD